MRGTQTAQRSECLIDRHEVMSIVAQAGNAASAEFTAAGVDCRHVRES